MEPSRRIIFVQKLDPRHIVHAKDVITYFENVEGVTLLRDEDSMLNLGGWLDDNQSGWYFTIASADLANMVDTTIRVKGNKLVIEKYSTLFVISKTIPSGPSKFEIIEAVKERIDGVQLFSCGDDFVGRPGFSAFAYYCGPTDMEKIKVCNQIRIGDTEFILRILRPGEDILPCVEDAVKSMAVERFAIVLCFERDCPPQRVFSRTDEEIIDAVRSQLTIDLGTFLNPAKWEAREGGIKEWYFSVKMSDVTALLAALDGNRVKIFGSYFQLKKCPKVKISSRDGVTQIFDWRVVDFFRTTESVSLFRCGAEEGDDDRTLSFYCPCSQLEIVSAMPPVVSMTGVNVTVTVTPCATKQVYIDVYHDAENCYCPPGVQADDVMDKTLLRVLEAFLGSTAAARSLDLRDTSAIKLKWHFVLHHRESSKYHPSTSFMRDLRIRGGIIIDPGVENDAVDTKIKSLLRAYCDNFECLSEAVRAQHIVVVITGDSDFALSVRSLRSLNENTVLIYNAATASKAFTSLVLPRYSLGHWGDIIGVPISAPFVDSPLPPPLPLSSPPPLPPSSPSRPVPPVIEVDNIWIYRFADHVFKVPGRLRSSINEFYSSTPGAQEAIAAAQGAKSFCAASGGALRFAADAGGLNVMTMSVRDLRACIAERGGASIDCIEKTDLQDRLKLMIGVIEISLPALLKLFVSSKGGQINASEMDLFYKMFTHSENLKLAVRSDGKVKGLCEASNGELVWVSHPLNETIGYGVIRLGGCAVVVDSTNSIQISWPKFYYIKKYLRTEIDSALKEFSANVEMKLSSQRDKLPTIVLSFVESEGEDAVGEIQRSNLMRRSEAYVKAIVDSIQSTLEEFAVTKPDIETNAEIQSLCNENQIYLDIKGKSGVIQAVSAAATGAGMKDSLSLDAIMKFPIAWSKIRLLVPPGGRAGGRMPFSGGGRGGRGGGRLGLAGLGGYTECIALASNEEIVARIRQYLQERHGIVGCAIQIARKPYVHAKLGLSTERQRTALLRSGLQVLPGVQFVESMATAYPPSAIGGGGVTAGTPDPTGPQKLTIFIMHRTQESQSSNPYLKPNFSAAHGDLTPKDRIVQIIRSMELVDMTCTFEELLQPRPASESPAKAKAVARATAAASKLEALLRFVMTGAMWRPLHQEIEATFNVSIIRNTKQRSLCISGRRSEGENVLRFLGKRLQELLVETIAVPKDQPDLLPAVMRRLTGLRSEHIRASGLASDGAINDGACDDDDDDDGDDVASDAASVCSDSTSSTHIAKHADRLSLIKFFLNPEGSVTIIATPQDRDTWRLYVGSAQQLIDSFKSESIPVKAEVQDKLELQQILRDFGLAACYYNSTGPPGLLPSSKKNKLSKPCKYQLNCHNPECNFAHPRGWQPPARRLPTRAVIAAPSPAIPPRKSAIAQDDVLWVKGEEESVDSAIAFIQQVIDGTKPQSRIVSISVSACLDPAVIARYCSLPEPQDQIKALCKQLKPAFKAKKVTATPVRSGEMLDSGLGDVGLLILHGPVAALDAAEALARAGLQDIMQDLPDEETWVPLAQHEVKWLVQNCGKLSDSRNVVIRFFDGETPFSGSEAALGAILAVPSAGSPEGLPGSTCSCWFDDVRVEVARCDFTQTRCEALVNSANSSLNNNGGIAFNIAMACGPLLSAACRRVIDSLPLRLVAEGSAVRTPAFNLEQLGFGTIVHTVVPNLTGGVRGVASSSQRQKLRQAVVASLNEATFEGASSIAMPGLGTGLFGWAEQAATAEVILAISEWTASATARDPACPLRRIVLFDQSEAVTEAFAVNLERLSSGVSLESTASEPVSHSRTTAAPPERPIVPQHRWFWALWDHEKRHTPEDLMFDIPQNFIDDQLKITPASTLRCMCPYDYDQVVQLEYAQKLGLDDCTLLGDLAGQRNGSQYDISFVQSTQTTNPCKNRLSVRPIFKIPLATAAAASEIPLYDERVRQYKAAKRQYESEVRSVKHAAPTARIQHFRRVGDVASSSLEVSATTAAAAAAAATDDCAGMSLFGMTNDVASMKRIYLGELSAAVKTRSTTLDNLQRHKFDFDVIVEEIKLLPKLQDLNISVEANASTWAVEVKGLGELAVSEAATELLNFEKQKIAALSEIRLPPEWGYDDLDDVENIKPTLVALGPDSREYLEAKRLFLGSDFSAAIVSIERVQNVELFLLYNEMKKSIARRCGMEDANEMILKHGTRLTPPDVIYNSGPNATNTHGFDLRYSADGFFGRGAYFAEQATYSHTYAHEVAGGGTHQMFLAAVAVGKSELKEVPDKYLRAPTAGFQSIRGRLNPAHYGYIVYEFDQSYPKYLVTYKKAE